MKNYFAKLHYSKNLTFFDLVLRAILSIFSVGYIVGVNFRNFLFSINGLKTAKVSAFVIAVGNLTTGGTGKTPITCQIARFFAEKGKKVAVLSRGYGGKLSNKDINIISDGEQIYFTAEMAGDEPYLIASSVKNAGVITCKDRVKAAEFAIKNWGTEIIVLDDGYQYRKLGRDVNILVVDGNNRFGNEMLLPAGPLREPMNEISRSDIIVVTNKNPSVIENSVNFANKLGQRYSKKAFEVDFHNGGVFDIYSGNSIEPGAKVYSFTGIGQPQLFFDYIERSGYELVGKRIFEDHYSYTAMDMKALLSQAAELGVDAFVTTEKDKVKILPVLSQIDEKIPFYELKLKISIENLLEELAESYEKNTGYQI